MSYTRSLLTKGLFLPASLLLPFSTSLAADLFWDNAGTGLFNEALNWNLDVAPTDVDNAFIANGGTAQLLIGEVGNANTLRVQHGAMEIVNASLITGITSSTWQSPGDLQIGGIAGQSGSLTVSGDSSIANGGSSIFTGRVRIGGWNDGADQGDMHGSLTMSGDSTLETATGGGYDFWVGNGAGSSGELNMSGASSITVNSSLTSGRAGGDGTIDLSGGSTLTVTGFANIGEDGTADWTVSDDASLQIGGNLRLGGTESFLTVEGLASLTVGGEFQIGNGGGNVGTVNFTGGTISASSWTSIGREGGTGNVTMSGNATLTKTGVGNLIVGDGTTGTMSVSGNASIVSDSDIWVGLNGGGNGTLTISGGSSQTSGSVIVARNDVAAQGALHLNGGSLTAISIQEGDGSGTVNFNGGTLRAGAASTDFITGFEAGDVVILAGGAVIDTNSFDVEITLALTGEGGLAKLGLGTLTLSGANTYLGDTAVAGGVLSITSGFLSDTANVSLGSGTEFHLDFVGTDTVNGLIIDGVGMEVGTWGALGSDADHESEFFTGTGFLEVTSVVPEPSTMALVFAGLAVAGWRLRRRRR